MLPKETTDALRKQMAETDHPRECAIEALYTLQKHYGYLTDEAVHEGADLLGMSPLEMEEIATFYDFLYREPVGRYVIHVCDSTICWMFGYQSLMDYLCEKLRIRVGGTSEDGLFTLLPVCCVGYCDQAPVMLVNGRPYGHLTPEVIDAVLLKLKEEAPPPVEDR